MRTLSLLLFCSALGAHAQTTAITNDGRRVMLNPDGTWKAIDTDASISAEDTTCTALVVEGTGADGKPSISSQLIVVSYDNGTTGLGIVLEAGAKKGQGTLRIKCAGTKEGIRKDAKVTFFFRDGSKENVVSDAVPNTKGDVPIHLGGSAGRKELIAALTGRKVRTIRVWTGEDFVERDLSEVNSTTLMYSARCLLK